MKRAEVSSGMARVSAGQEVFLHDSSWTVMSSHICTGQSSDYIHGKRLGPLRERDIDGVRKVESQDNRCDYV